MWRNLPAVKTVTIDDGWDPTACRPNPADAYAAVVEDQGGSLSIVR
jgi:hypothetical protein